MLPTRGLRFLFGIDARKQRDYRKTSEKTVTARGIYIHNVYHTAAPCVSDNNNVL